MRAVRNSMWDPVVQGEPEGSLCVLTGRPEHLAVCLCLSSARGPTGSGSPLPALRPQPAHPLHLCPEVLFTEGFGLGRFFHADLGFLNFSLLHFLSASVAPHLPSASGDSFLR